MLDELRRKAVDLARAHEWESLLAMEMQLSQDEAVAAGPASAT